MSSPGKYLGLSGKLAESWLLNIVKTTSQRNAKDNRNQMSARCHQAPFFYNNKTSLRSTNIFFSPNEVPPPPPVKFFITIFQQFAKYFDNSENKKLQ